MDDRSGRQSRAPKKRQSHSDGEAGNLKTRRDLNHLYGVLSRRVL